MTTFRKSNIKAIGNSPKLTYQEVQAKLTSTINFNADENVTIIVGISACDSEYSLHTSDLSIFGSKSKKHIESKVLSALNPSTAIGSVEKLIISNLSYKVWINLKIPKQK